MIEIRTFTAQNEWNEVVCSFPAADIRQSYEWGEIRQRAGWAPLRLAAFDGPECRAALAALVWRVPGIGPVAYAPRGPLVRYDDPSAGAALAAAVAAVRRVTGAVVLRVSPGLAHGADLGVLRAVGFRPIDDFWSVWNAPRNVMRLPLEGAERELLGRMARKRRQHISTAAKKGITIEMPTDVEALHRFYALHVEHGARHGYPVRPLAYFQRMWHLLVPQKTLALIFGLVGGELACAMLAVRFGVTAYALQAPSGPAAAGTGVGDVVHWELMRWAKTGGCMEIDFGSSGTHVPPRDTDAGLGIYRFKIEIGCRLELKAPYQDAVFERVRYRAFRLVERRLLPRARAWLQRLPAGVRAILARRGGVSEAAPAEGRRIPPGLQRIS